MSDTWRDMTLGELADLVEADEELLGLVGSWLADNPEVIQSVIDWIIGHLAPGAAA